MVNEINGIQFEIVQPSTVELAVSILNEAADWIRSKDIEQWGHFETGDFTESIQKQRLWIGYLNSQPVATLLLYYQQEPFDRLIWGELPDDAAYVHRLATRRSMAGQGLGVRVLNWVENQAIKQGKQYLRLDCMAENPGLNRFYQQTGFTNNGPFEVGKWKGNLYEKCLVK